MPLGVLVPWFLAGAAAIAIPILLHLQRRRRVRLVVPFPAVRLLQPLDASDAPRRLHDLALLALRIAAILALAVAFARPYLRGLGERAGRTVTLVAVDRSFSLSAPGQAVEARRLARAAVEAAPAGALVALAAFDESADLLVAPTSDRAIVRSAIEQITPGFGRTRYRPVFDRAAEVFGERSGTVVLVTDLQAQGWEQEGSARLPPGVTLVLARVPSPDGNLAVTRIERRGPELVAEVANAGTSAATAEAVLTVDGQTRGARTATVTAHGTGEVAWSMADVARGVARVEIRDPRGYAGDNVRLAVLDRATPPALLVVTGADTRDAFFVERAATASPREPWRVTVRPAAEIERDRPLDKFEAIVILGTTGLDRRIAGPVGAYLARGRGVLVAAGPSTDAAIIRAVFGRDLFVPASAVAPPQSLAVADARHPVARPFGAAPALLEQVQVTTRALPDGVGASPIVAFTDGRPAIVERTADAGRLIVSGVDLTGHWSDLPRRTAFVPLVVEMLRDLRGAPQAPGEVTVGWRSRADAMTPGVIAADGETAGAGGTRVAVNVDGRESVLSQLDESAFRSHVSDRRQAAGLAESPPDHWPLWWFAVVAALLALAAESVVVARRVRA